MKRCWILLLCISVMLTACSGNQTSTSADAAFVAVYAPGGELLRTYQDVDITNVSETCICVYESTDDPGTLYKNVTAVITWN